MLMVFDHPTKSERGCLESVVLIDIRWSELEVVQLGLATAPHAYLTRKALGEPHTHIRPSGDLP